MTNKIPQEIEESLTAQNIYNEFELKAGIHIGTEERLIIQAIQKGFKAGQKQSEDAFKEMIEEWNIIYDNGTSFFEKKDGSFRTNSGEVFVKELLSQLNSKEKKQND